MTDALGRTWATTARPADVWLRSGTYAVPAGAQQFGFVHRPGLDVYGGFAGTETAPDQRAPSNAASIIDGEILGDDPPGIGNLADNAWGVWTPHESLRAGDPMRMDLVDGVTLRGSGTVQVPIHAERSMRFERCVFTENVGQTIFYDDFRVHPQVFSSCVFTGNIAGAVWSRNALVEQCLIHANDAFIDVLSLAWPSQVRNSTITDNLIGWPSGRRAVCLDPGPNGGMPPGVFTNTIVYGNRRTDGTAGLAAQAHIASGTTVDWNCIEGWGATGTGNISADPSFADPLGPDGMPRTGDEDLRLGPASPCIDAGGNAAILPGLDVDLDHGPRRADDAAVPDTGQGAPPIVDMGVFERRS